MPSLDRKPACFCRYVGAWCCLYVGHVPHPLVLPPALFTLFTLTLLPATLALLHVLAPAPDEHREDRASATPITAPHS